MIHFDLIAKEKMEIILPLLAQADSNIQPADLENRLKLMLKKGYECVGVFDEDNLIGICGLWTLVKYYVGEHLEPDNVFIQPAYRKKGIGKKLNHWLEQLAKKRGIKVLELNCYVENSAGQEFWQKQGYQQIGLHYQKKI